MSEKIEIKVGDKVQDCDPRSNGRVKEVVEVLEEYIVVKGAALSQVRIDRVHNKLGRKKGYYHCGRGEG